MKNLKTTPTQSRGAGLSLLPRAAEMASIELCIHCSTGHTYPQVYDVTFVGCVGPDGAKPGPFVGRI